MNHSNVCLRIVVVVVVVLCETKDIYACKVQAMKSYLSNDISGFCEYVDSIITLYLYYWLEDPRS